MEEQSPLGIGTRLAPFHGAGARSDVTALERLFACEKALSWQLRLHPSVDTKMIPLHQSPRPTLKLHRFHSGQQLKNGEQQTPCNIWYDRSSGTPVWL